MELANSQSMVALIVGVTGMVSLSLAEEPHCVAGPWKAYGFTQHPKLAWFPDSTIDQYIAFDATDANDTLHNLPPVANKVTHVFWVAIQGLESEEGNIRVNAIMLANVLNVLKSASPSRLAHITVQTGTQHYMGLVHDPIQSGHLITHEPPFHEDLPRLPYPNFYYALEEIIASYTPSISYSVHHSSIIIGASSRSVYNALLTLAIYATISQHEGYHFDTWVLAIRGSIFVTCQTHVCWLSNTYGV
ncbi:hypothetical protein SLEP1_g40081 [Rubroshorea leprosula]|uniref:Uncharacterized protein n=1 Tax=Rubroshorea leprosula TaxID=152421 RepID=A0AAV5L343_9ROSI|nr:hypothetical protein SLEP1_g40081 [Rubroshorea leprosula]